MELTVLSHTCIPDQDDQSFFFVYESIAVVDGSPFTALFVSYIPLSQAEVEERTEGCYNLERGMM